MDRQCEGEQVSNADYPSERIHAISPAEAIITRSEEMVR
jgi:hypothetical protein